MVKYLPDTVTVSKDEIPNKTVLMIELTQCRNNCTGCKTPWLKDNIGEFLDERALGELLVNNKGIDCVVFSPEGSHTGDLTYIASMVHQFAWADLEVAVYCGRKSLGDDKKAYEGVFDYIRLGQYTKTKRNNQILYHIIRKDDGSVVWEEMEKEGVVEK